ncbi:hypothetical protein [Paraburkholderia sp. RL17-373-BIF-A]|uniref:hypothetical protein n=1 Tax=Paraburkholderia sp. RL17-373-BIF-A TaxID=3031629 RepID=UPI0038B76B4C
MPSIFHRLATVNDARAHITLAELVKLVHGQHDSAARAKTVAKVREAAAKLIAAEIERRG